MTRLSFLAAGIACTALPAGTMGAQVAAKCIMGTHTTPHTLGGTNICSVPTWMKQTTDTISLEVEALEKQGLVSKLMITDAQGNANTQTQQIQSSTIGPA